jgi:hypothetical protein
VSGPGWRVLLTALLLTLAAAGGCSAPGPTAGCLTDAPQAVTLPFQHFEKVSHEIAGDSEVARFVFDPAVAGQVRVTVQRTLPQPYREFNTGEIIEVKREQFWSVRVDGLVGGAATDRIQVDPGETALIREVVQVVDAEDFRWVVGTAARACVRLGGMPETATVVLHATAR